MLYFTGFVKSIRSEDSSQSKSPLRRQGPRDRVILKAFLEGVLSPLMMEFLKVGFDQALQVIKSLKVSSRLWASHPSKLKGHKFVYSYMCAPLRERVFIKFLKGIMTLH